MPSPSASLASLRPDLASSVLEFDLAMSQRGFIAQRILPIIEVGSPIGMFGKIPVAQLLQNRDVERAPGAGYSRSGFTFETETYATRERGAEDPIDDREATIYRNFFDAELIGTMRCRDAILRAQEIRVADLVFNETRQAALSPAMFADVTNEWDDATNATPISDIETAVRAVYGATGLWPNALVMNRMVYRNLRNTNQVKDAIESGGAGGASTARDIGPSQLASIFDLDRIIIAGELYNSGKEGQNATFTQIWSNEYAAVVRVPTSPQDVRDPGLGRIFHYAEDGSQVDGTVESYREEAVRSDVIRVRHEVDERIYYPAAMYLLGNVTTI